MTLEDAVSVFSFSRHLYSAGFGEKKKKNVDIFFCLCRKLQYFDQGVKIQLFLTVLTVN